MLKSKISKMTRENLIQFMKTYFKVILTFISATDAILYCRGPHLDSSDYFDESKLLLWL